MRVCSFGAAANVGCDTEFAASVAAQKLWRKEARKFITFHATIYPSYQNAHFLVFYQRVN